MKGYLKAPRGYRLRHLGKIRSGDRLWDFYSACWGDPLKHGDLYIGRPIECQYPWHVARREKKKARK